MNTMVEQLWFIEDQFNVFEDIKLSISKNKKIKKINPMQDWADGLGHQIGEFNINLKRRMIEDPMGEAVMPIFPHFIGASEEYVIKEIYACLGE